LIALRDPHGVVDGPNLFQVRWTSRNAIDYQDNKWSFYDYANNNPLRWKTPFAALAFAADDPGAGKGVRHRFFEEHRVALYLERVFLTVADCSLRDRMDLILVDAG